MAQKQKLSNWSINISINGSMNISIGGCIDELFTDRSINRLIDTCIDRCIGRSFYGYNLSINILTHPLIYWSLYLMVDALLQTSIDTAPTNATDTATVPTSTTLATEKSSAADASDATEVAPAHTSTYNTKNNNDWSIHICISYNYRIKNDIITTIRWATMNPIRRFTEPFLEWWKAEGPNMYHQEKAPSSCIRHKTIAYYLHFEQCDLFINSIQIPLGRKIYYCLS